VVNVSRAERLAPPQSVAWLRGNSDKRKQAWRAARELEQLWRYGHQANRRTRKSAARRQTTATAHANAS